MPRSRHFPAYDFDCDDVDLESSPRVVPPNAHRRIRTRRVHGEGVVAKEEMLVHCPFRDRWPSFDECLGCEHWRGYSLDPAGRDSFMSCARADEIRWAMPLDPSERSRAMRTRIGEVMRDPVCVRRDMDFDELATFFVDRGVSSAPVVDAEGRPIGVVSKTDLVEARAGRIDAETGPSEMPIERGFQEDRRSSLTVAELMTPVVYSLPASASIADAVALMAGKDVHGVPIVSPSGHVVGMLTALDVACWIDAPQGRRGIACPAAL
jgi:CBS domain-containing protein